MALAAACSAPLLSPARSSHSDVVNPNSSSHNNNNSSNRRAFNSATREHQLERIAREIYLASLG
jgi:hypothetical protein